MSSHITDCINNYKNSFSPDWINQLAWEEDSSIMSFQNGRITIEQFINSSFILLTKSVLSGEYLLNSTKQRLIKFEQLLSIDSNPHLNSDNEFKNSLLKRFVDMNLDFNHAIKHYRKLIDIVEDKVEPSNNDLLFSAFSKPLNSYKNNLYYSFEHHVIGLALQDHLLFFEEDILSKLILLREELQQIPIDNDAEITEIYKALELKCTYLLKKLISRSNNREYSLDFKRCIINIDDYDIDTLKELYENFEFLYGKKNLIYNQKIKKWQENSIQKKSKLSELIMLMKYYQKDNGSKEQINDLISEFDDIYNRLYLIKIRNSFDRYALNTIKNYLHNSRFAYLIDHQISFNELNKELSAIGVIQKKTYIKNFYPYKKAIDYLIPLIQRELKNNNTNIINEYVKYLNELIEKFEISIKWCSKRKFYPFQLMENECHCKYNNIDIFIPSAYTKPINYQELLNELSQYKLTWISLKGQLEILKEKREVLLMRDQIRLSEKKYLEILGAFTAIITFLFGCINFFSTARTAQDLTFSSFGLGIILLLFSSMIYFLTIPRLTNFYDYLKHPRFWFFSLSSIVYFIVLLKTIL